MLFPENESEKTKKPDSFEPGFLWYHLELNQGHTDFQSVALPTELWYLPFWRCKYTAKFKTAKKKLKKFRVFCGNAG